MNSLPDTNTFRTVVYDYYHRNKRDFPWRGAVTPYHILVSEFMLQQTQTSRVVDKFIAFVDKLPDFEALASCETSQLLSLWQGLGYNRRALYVKRTAQGICERFEGVVPEDPALLKTLPGIGEYTSKAIAAFAFNRPVVLVETNVRTVFIHHFFSGRETVDDSDILPLVEQTLPRDDARRWYSALMDYGVYLKKTVGNLSRRSGQHTKQPTFSGSDRQLRGKLVRHFLEHRTASDIRLQKTFPGEDHRLPRILDDLGKEGFITAEPGGTYKILS